MRRRKKHSDEVRQFILTPDCDSESAELGREYQQEKHWPKLAMAPVYTYRDADLKQSVDWDTLLTELPSEEHYGIVRHRSWAYGWHEALYFNPCHRKTERVVLDVLRRIREDGCADRDELAEREIDQLAEEIRGDIWHLPHGMEYEDVANALRQRGDWIDGNSEYTAGKARDEIQEIAHAYDDYFDDGNCVCGLDTEAPVHHRGVQQIHGQTTVFELMEHQ